MWLEVYPSRCNYIEVSYVPVKFPGINVFFFWLGGATWWSKVALSVASGCLGLWILAMTDRCWFYISPVSYFLHLFIVWNPSRNCKHFSSHRLPSLARSLHNHLKPSLTLPNSVLSTLESFEIILIWVRCTCQRLFCLTLVQSKMISWWLIADIWMLIIIVFENHSKTELAVALVVKINDFQHHSIQR